MNAFRSQLHPVFLQAWPGSAVGLLSRTRTDLELHALSLARLVDDELRAL